VPGHLRCPARPGRRRGRPPPAYVFYPRRLVAAVGLVQDFRPPMKSVVASVVLCGGVVGVVVELVLVEDAGHALFDPGDESGDQFGRLLAL